MVLLFKKMFIYDLTAFVMCNVQQIMYRIMIILDSSNLISTTLFVCQRLLHTFICGRGEERGYGFYFF